MSRGLAVKRREGHVPFFGRVEDKNSSIVYKIGKLPVVSLSLSNFVVFFVFTFSICVQYLIRILLNRKCSCSINSNVRQVFDCGGDEEIYRNHNEGLDLGGCLGIAVQAFYSSGQI